MTQTTRHGDHEVKVAAANELAWTPAVNADQVGLMEEIPRVRSVQDGVKIAPNLPFAASTAAKSICAAFVRNARVDAELVHVTTTGREIELTGRTRTWVERKEAADVAGNTPGVTQVHNNLHVIP